MPGISLRGARVEGRKPCCSELSAIWSAPWDDGVLISYGADVSDLLRRAAGYVDRILNWGENGGPLHRAAPKFVLALNLKTAKALGLTIPTSLVLQADHVIK